MSTFFNLREQCPKKKLNVKLTSYVNNTINTIPDDIVKVIYSLNDFFYH